MLTLRRLEEALEQINPERDIDDMLKVRINLHFR